MDYRAQNKSSWNTQSVRYQKQAKLNTKVFDFGDNSFPTDNDLGLVGDVKGKKILELGCGAANIGIFLAKQGGIVKGVDISESQIKSAKRNAEKENVFIKFEISAVEEYGFQEKYDMVVSICALQYVNNLSVIFQRIFDSLENKGVFIFSTDHPAFATVAANSLWKDDTEEHSYKYEKPETWKWEESDDFQFITFPHSIEYYVNALAGCGFVIERLHELLRNKIRDKLNEEEKLELLYPRYLVIKARKGV